MVTLGREGGASVLWEPKREAAALPYLETASQISDADHLVEHKASGWKRTRTSQAERRL